MFFPKCALNGPPRLWRYTCTSRGKLSISRRHSSLRISLTFAVIASFSSPFVWGMGEGVAISKQGIIGPCWLEDKNESAPTVNTESYVTLLRKFWTSLGRRRGIDEAERWFHQDVSTIHTSDDSLAWLREQFRHGRLTSGKYALHSPYLNVRALSRFSSVRLSYLKDGVRQNNDWWTEGRNYSKSQEIINGRE